MQPNHTSFTFISIFAQSSTVLMTKKLAQRIKKNLKQTNAQIKIRPIIITQADNTHGEFYGHGIDDVSKALQETDEQLIHRIMLHIQDVAEMVKVCHLEDNFEHPQNFHSPQSLRELASTLVPSIVERKKARKKMSLLDPTDYEFQHLIWSRGSDGIVRRDFKAEYESDILDKVAELKKSKSPFATMKSDCLNNITIGIFNEFYFYPYRDRGPLSQAALGALIDKTEIMAKGMPENMLLFIASMPVVDPLNGVRNMALYVQCGPDPIIKSMTKALPSPIDPEYPFTHSPYFAYGSQGTPFKNALLKKKEQLIQLAPEDISINDIIEFVQLCESNNDFKLDALDDLHPLENLRTRIDELTEAIKANTVEPLLLLQLSMAITNFCQNILKKSKDSLNAANERINAKHLPMVGLPQQGCYGVNYGGQIEYETAGKAMLNIAFDLCMDLSFSIASTQFNNFITAQEKHLHSFRSNSLFQIVSSNVIHIEPKMVIGNYVAHADPYHHTVIPKQSIKNLHVRYDDRAPEPQTELYIEQVSSYFGAKKPQVRLFSQQVADEFTGDLKEKIERHNTWLEHLTLLHHQKKTHPEHAAEIDRQIHLIQLGIAIETMDSDEACNILKKTIDFRSQRKLEVDLLHLFRANYQYYSEDKLANLFPLLLDLPEFKAIKYAYDKFIYFMLYYSMSHEHQQVFSILVQYMDKKLLNHYENKLTLLHRAVHLRQFDMAKELVLRGANLNLRTRTISKYAPIHFILENNLPKIFLKFFLEHGADLVSRNGRGKNGLELIQESTNLDFQQIYFDYTQQTLGLFALERYS